MLIITPYNAQYQNAVIDLITHIQQIEFGVPITLADQPDLLQIEQFYQTQKGEFWVALNTAYQVVGTIALIDNGEEYGTIRKMFVRADYRGSEKHVSRLLLSRLEQQAQFNGMKALYLGTHDILKGSHKFYVKNGFEEIAKENLPANYPLMQVDTLFFAKTL
jgi:N-acetylglutamate synthase-like GNAT family acetyltransferase